MNWYLFPCLKWPLHFMEHYKYQKESFESTWNKYWGKKFVRQLSSPPNDPLCNSQPLAWIFLWIWLKCEHQGKRELLKPPLSVVRGRMWWWATANNYCNSITRWFQSETLVNISLMSFAHTVFQLLHTGIYSSSFLFSSLWTVCGMCHPAWYGFITFCWRIHHPPYRYEICTGKN